MPTIYDDPGQLEEKEQGAPSKEPPEHGTPAELLERIPTMGHDEAKKLDKKRGLDKGDLGKAEAAPGHDDQVGRGYNPDSINKNQLRIGGGRGLLKTRRSRFIAGGAIAGTIIAGIVAAIISLIPLKILDFVQNIQDKAFFSAQLASQKEVGKLESDYIRKLLKSCGNKVDRNCNPFPAGTNPVTKLFIGWKNAKLEDTLASKYNIEFKKVGKHYYMKAPGMTGDGAVVDDFINEDQTQLFSLDDYIDKHAKDPQWQKVDRATIRQYVKDATASETRWKRVFFRFKVGRLLEEKYGIKRCIIFCGPRDKLADTVQAQKDAAKLYLVERVIQPNDEALAVVLKCFFSAASSSQCDPTKYTVEPCKEGENCELNGAPENPETDKALRQSLESLAKTFGIADGPALEGLLSKLETDGFKKFLIKYVMLNVFKKEVSDTTVDRLSTAIPLLGWLNMASQIIHFADKAGPTIKKLTYIRNAAAAVALYSMYRTYADEVKNGNANAREVGSFVSALGPVANSNLPDLKGGTAGAEQTPLYSDMLGSHTGTGSSAYKCDKGGQPTGGSGLKLTCPEEKLSQNSDVFDALKTAVDGSGLAFLANIWAQTFGRAFSLFGSLLGNLFSIIFGTIGQVADKACDTFIVRNIVPWAPYCSARGAIKTATKNIIDFATNTLFPTPFSQNMSGGRTFDMMAAGGDVAANDEAHFGIGGQRMNPIQVGQIQNDQAQEALQSYKNQPFFSRMFDTQSQYAPVTKLAMAVPSSSGQALSNIASYVTNPFSHLFHSFSSIFGGVALADTGSTRGDAFGVPQYGYPDGPIIIHSTPAGPFEGKDFWQIDHTDFWTAYCEPKNPDGSENKVYDSYYTGYNLESAASPDPDNGMPTNSRTNACLLIQGATGDAGATYDSSLLTPDELAGASGSSSTPSTTASSGSLDVTAYSNPFHGTQPGSARIDQGVDYSGSGDVYAIGNGTVDLADTSTGWPGPGGRGSFISYKLTDGPAAGKEIYVAEYCTLNPALKKGSPVNTGTRLCTMTGGGIETGWAGPGIDNSIDVGLSLNCYSISNSTATVFGINFSDLMKALGAPPGIKQDPTSCQDPKTGGVPAGWPTW